MYYISLERSSLGVFPACCCIKIHMEWLTNHRLNIECFIFTGARVYMTAFSHILCFNKDICNSFIIQNGGY